MEWMQSLRGLWLTVTATLVFASPAVAGPTVFEIVGLDALQARLGANTPTGLTIHVAQVEAENASGEYGPNQNDGEFPGKTFIAHSGAPGTTGHATNVGRNMYGVNISIAPDVDMIHLYAATHWVTTGFLRATSGSTTPPLATPTGVRSFNHSWIGDFQNVTLNNSALRRADLVMDRDNVLMTIGMPNAGMAKVPLMAHVFNGISVGRHDANHTAGDTAGTDVPMRMKPEIVSPGFDGSGNPATSWSTPVVDAATSLLFETARFDKSVAQNPNANTPEVIKAVILAGAVHEDNGDGEWSNDPDLSGPNRGVTDRPIDDVVGVGTLNINRSHFILTGAEQDGEAAAPDSPNADWRGWDRAQFTAGESMFYRFKIRRPADEVSILATWNRFVSQQNINTWAVADFDLILWRVNSQCDLASLVGDAGLPYFTGGNVVSASLVDNVEHLYLTGLEPGDYVIELVRLDSNPTIPTATAVIAWLAPEPPANFADVDGDGDVDFDDFTQLLASWSDCAGGPADIDGDGDVDFDDFTALLAAWTG